MTTDLIQRIRDNAKDPVDFEAADEIERLRSILQAVRLYERWAGKGGQPKDAEGRIAHDEIMFALRKYNSRKNQ